MGISQQPIEAQAAEAMAKPQASTELATQSIPISDGEVIRHSANRIQSILYQLAAIADELA